MCTVMAPLANHRYTVPSTGDLLPAAESLTPKSEVQNGSIWGSGLWFVTQIGTLWDPI